MKILGIETSCDETAAAVVQEGRLILSNLVASQVRLHAPYGGVVPELASRQHLLTLVPLVRSALEEAGLGWGDLDAIAVTKGPGLAGSLLVGVNLAKAIALARGLPLLGVNHLEGHIYANWLLEDGKRWQGGRWEGPAKELRLPEFPLLVLIASGGHTELILMRGHGDYQLLGRTRDDAAGEAFDKVARILGLGYPGGPAIQRAAQEGNPAAYPVPRAWLRDSPDFSFSGMKTAMVRLVEECRRAAGGGPPLPVADLAASFQRAMVDVLVGKTLEAAQRLGARQILLSGGVAANALLQHTFQKQSNIAVICPSPSLCTDNAAMIAACAYFRLRAGPPDPFSLDLEPGASLA